MLGKTRMAMVICVTVWLAVSANAASPADRTPDTILVNFGGYPSAEAAANGQDSVDWYDDDTKPDTICTEAFAAVELRRYLCRMAGLDPADAKNLVFEDDETGASPYAFVVGSPANNVIARDRDYQRLLLTGDEAPGGGVRGGFQIKTYRRNGMNYIFLCGNDRAGTLYAVYAYLEHLGCRWYGPGEVNEVVPRRSLSDLPEVDMVDWPRFRTRGFWAWEDRGNPDFFDWMARNRMNLWTSAQSGIPELKKRCIDLTCGGHQHHARFLNPAAAYPYDHPRFKGDEDKPKDPYKVGKGYGGDANGDGVLTYAEAHPEWYGLRGGKRITNLAANVNFCTSNQDAVAEMMGNLVRDLIDGQWRYADSVDFWTLDGGRWCECKDCKALGTPTDRNLLLVHALRNEIKRAMREKRLRRNVRVAFLAYADVIDPPSRPLPPEFDYENCIATFFPILRCYVHKFDDPTCTEFNTRYQKHFHGWAIDPNRHYRGQIFIGEYYNVSGYKNLPVLYYETMPNDIRYFYKYGARHMHYMHAPTGNWGPRTLTNYMLARLLWNPQVDTDELMVSYGLHRYSEEATTMRRFYATLEGALNNVTPLKYDLARNLARGRKQPFTKAHMSRNDFNRIVGKVRSARRLIDRALAEARKSETRPHVVRRIEEDERLFRYAENTILFHDALLRTRDALGEGKRAEAGAALADADRFADLLRRDAESTRWASSHANATNALEASFAAPELERLRKALKAGER